MVGTKRYMLFFAVGVAICGRIFLGVLRDNDAAPGLATTASSVLAADAAAASPPAYPVPTQDPTSSINSHISYNVTVYLHRVANLRINPAHSIFKTDTLDRYGSGRLRYIVHDLDTRLDYNQCVNACDAEILDTGGGDIPCLATASEKGHCRYKQIKCAHPRCKTMVTNDELCVAKRYEVREYYSSRITNAVYLPLGPRFEAWESFRKFQNGAEIPMIPASRRRFTFNAIFSQSTNPERAKLAEIVEGEIIPGNLTIYTSMWGEWALHPNDPGSNTLNTDDYAWALSESAFTLSPAGKSPECFRLYEAAEAGSIPVLVRSDLATHTRERSQCRNSLHHWRDAPIVVLDSWDQLYPRMEMLLEDSKGLDEMQARLRSWYDSFMHSVVNDFENFMIDSYGLDRST